jgi:NADPH-dependent 2,4-dienoyl-CoA reductase/sulfur reductase-like enzyme
MTRVVVAGGGVAGVAAAVSASETGADVIIAEGSGRLACDKSLLPRLLSGASPQAALGAADPDDLAARLGIETRLGEEVVAVDPDAGLIRTRGGRITFDALVLATGSSSIPEDLRGISKPGVFVMRSPDDYLALSRSLGGISRVALAGSLPLSLIVAEAIASSSCCRAVSVFIGEAPLPRFSRRVLGMISSAASSRGVELLEGRVDAVVGVKRAEAVISAGMVHPCDGVVILPRSSPSLPSLDCLRGDHGGAIVDDSMRTSCRRVYAAGDCAEPRFGSASLPSRLHSSSLVMGEVAGINAAGGTARASLSRCIALELFGVELCTTGIDTDGARKMGLDAVEFESGAEGGPIGTSLVYDRTTHRLYGIQVAGPGALSLSDYASYAISSGGRLDDLAYNESPHLPLFNRDRSPISLTAGRALTTQRR